jgi:hypothetical protein
MTLRDGSKETKEVRQKGFGQGKRYTLEAPFAAKPFKRS